MKIIRLNLTKVFCFLIFSSSVSAGEIVNGQVTQVYCGYHNGSNMCSIGFDADLRRAASCHLEGRKRMIIKTDDETGKAMLSIALIALSTQKTVDVIGKDTCSVEAGAEDINLMSIKN